jgi:ketosteroid isomerase-like protein
MPTLADAPFTAQDQTALRSMFDAAIRMINAGDWAAWAAQYAEDGLLQPPNGPTVRGRPDLLEWGRAFPPIEELAFSGVETHGEGSLAWGRSEYTLRLKGQAPDTGKQLVVFRRAADGAWKIVAASFNSDLPVPGPVLSE